jgi:hypothetical protein
MNTLSSSNLRPIIDHLDQFFLKAKQGKLKSPFWMKDPKIRDTNVLELAQYPTVISLIATGIKVEGLLDLHEGKRFSALNTLLFSSCYKMFELESSHSRLLTILHAISHVDGPAESFLGPRMFFSKTSMLLDFASMLMTRQFDETEIHVIRFLVVDRLEFLSTNSYNVELLYDWKTKSQRETGKLDQFYSILSEAVLLAFVFYASSLVLPSSSQRLCRMKIKSYILPILEEFKDDLSRLDYLRESRAISIFCSKPSNFYTKATEGIALLKFRNFTFEPLDQLVQLFGSNRPKRFKSNVIDQIEVNSQFTGSIKNFISLIYGH